MKRITLYILFILITGILQAQTEYKYIRQGNKKYLNKKYQQAETDYTKALKINPHSIIAGYNLANTYFEQKNYKNAIEMLINLSAHNVSNDTLSKIYYNLGETYLYKAHSINPELVADSLKMQALTEKGEYYKRSLEAFKKALIYNPNDKQAQFNYLIVKKIIDENKKQQQQQQQQQNKQNKQNKQNQQQNKQNKQQQQNQQQNKQQQQNQQQQQQQQNQQQYDRILNQIDKMDNQAQKKVHKNSQTYQYKKKNW